MAKPTQNKEQTILEAAEGEFLSKGFAGARTTSIAQRAGVTHAMLHYYFRTKEHLFERILDQKMRQMGDLVLSAFGQPGLPLMERLEVGISRHFDFLIANPDLPRFLINEMASKTERYELMQRNARPIVDALVHGFQRELDASAERGETEWMDVRHLMLDVLSLNIFAFVAYPVVEPLFGDLTQDRAAFFEQRRCENIATIKRRLIKQ